jgi:hypothetical protein
VKERNKAQEHLMNATVNRFANDLATLYLDIAKQHGSKPRTRCLGVFVLMMNAWGHKKKESRLPRRSPLYHTPKDWDLKNTRINSIMLDPIEETPYQCINLAFFQPLRDPSSYPHNARAVPNANVSPFDTQEEYSRIQSDA